MALHRFEAAERDLRAVLERAPANRQALNNLGAICIRQRRLGEAVGRFRRGLEKLPSDTGWLTNLAAAMEMQNDLSGAAQATQQALDAHPEAISPLAPPLRPYLRSGNYPDVLSGLAAGDLNREGERFWTLAEEPHGAP